MTPPQLRWLLCDYGNVLSLAQPDEDVAALAELAEVPRSEFAERYWADRAAYDRAELDARSYWERLVGAALSPSVLRDLVALDVKSWTNLNTASVQAAERAAGRGFALALLSNAPLEVARAVEALEDLAPFHPRWFSCDLGATKPHPSVYATVLEGLDAAAGSITFVDDRPDNVEAARRAGFRAVLFEDPAQIDEL
jgi:putative hydrolase of the HAD superfamily